MPLSPEDVVKKTFNFRLRGYNMDQVDAFLEEVVHELRRLHSEIDHLRAQGDVGRHRQGSSAASVESEERLAIEQEQLEQVRRERATLVAEMTTLQERYDQLKTGSARDEETPLEELED